MERNFAHNFAEQQNRSATEIIRIAVNLGRVQRRKCKLQFPMERPDCARIILGGFFMNTKVLSVGGSIVAPEYPDVDFVTRFVEMIKDFLSKNPDDRLILVVGGGGPARIYQKAFRDVTGTAENEGTDAADWIGIMATHRCHTAPLSHFCN